MNVKLKVATVGAMFFLGHSAIAQSDTASVRNIEEVIVVGYSKVNKQSYTGTAAQVNKESVDRKSVSTVSQALAGEVAGVRVINTSGQPGSEATIRIRGFGSVNGNRAPLYVVDGAPFTGNISSINPDDIESMTVLKDATATAIYGSRGANGVILVNTKRGSGSKSVIQLESKVGFNFNLLPRYDVIKSPEDYIGLSWEALYNQGRLTAAGQADPVAYANARLFSTAGVQSKYNMWGVPASQLIDPTTKQVRPGTSRLYDPENWEDYGFQGAIRTENNLSISGGTGKTRYYTGIGYLKDEGYIINSNYERYSGRVNVTHQAKDWLRGEFNMGYAHSKTKQNGQSSDSGSIFWFVDNIPSIYPLFSRDAKGNKINDLIFGGYQFDYGEGRGFGGLTNAIADATYNKDGNRRHEFNGNMLLEAKISPFLTFETRFAGQYFNTSRDVLNNAYYGSAAGQGGSIFKSKSEMFSWNWLQLLRFNKKFGDHSIEAFAAHENNSWQFNYLSGSKNGLFTDHIPEWNNAAVQGVTSSYMQDYMLESYFGQINYDYKNKYFLTVTGRTDGSSRFIRNKWDSFYSAGASWIVSNEDFYNKDSFLSSLKLKASYGVMGDQAGVDYYSGYNVYGVGNFMGLPSSPFSRIGYPDLTWETARMFQTGAEFSLFKNKAIDVTIDYYKKTTDNLIFDKRIAPSTGNAISKVNDGVLINQGLEFNILAKVINKADFYLTAGMNGEILKNKLTEMPSDMSQPGGKKIIDLSESGFGRVAGRSMYDFYMREWAGVNAQTGAAQWVVHYVDANGDGKFNTGEQIGSLHDYKVLNPDAVISEDVTENYAQATQKFVGKSAIPKFSGAFNLNAGYKGFFVGAQMLYSFGGYAYDGAYAGLMGNGQVGGNNWHKDIYNRWQNAGDITDTPRLTSNRTGDTNYTARSTRFLTKADYLVLNNVTIGYTVPKTLIENMGISNLQLTLTGDNLWLKSERDGFNPSTNEIGSSDTYRYSPLSTLTMGVKFNF